ncbi:FG-GAP repeat domain-containing protein [Streptomyces sp. NPDC056944]|uniref:FG-GAP repeat domain-containing protein n=1 Tax=unclassified Streptomyces TaxID=2593676 RepID=UPI00363F97EA
MNHALPLHRLATAVAVTFAVTTGGLTAEPALAASATPTAAPSAEEKSSPAVVSPGSRLLGGGPSGFLSRVVEREQRIYSWTRYADGVTTVLPAAPSYRGGNGSDLVVRPDGSGYQVYDMAAGGDPVVIDTAFLGPTATLFQPVGDALLLRTGEASGHALHLVSRPQGEVVHRQIIGFPADTTIVSGQFTAPGVYAVHYTGTVGGKTGPRLAVVDLAEATVVDDRAVPAIDPTSWVSASATHVAWVEHLADGRPVVVTAHRGSPTTSRYVLPSKSTGITVGLMNGWVTYTVPGGAAADMPNSLHPLTALSLHDNSTTVKLLDSSVTVQTGANGALAQGGTLADGEGFYRIALGADGRPAATMVATSKVASELTEVRREIPESMDFSKGGTRVQLRWWLNRPNAHVNVELVHKRTGQRWRNFLGPSDRTGGFVTDWDGVFPDFSAALNGEYTWTLTASSDNGIGPDLKRTGTLRVDSGTAPHDYSDKGSPDLLARTDAGRLISYDVRQLRSPWIVDWDLTDRGAGWNVYDRLVATGDLAGSKYADLIARDHSGVLWFYQGTGPSLAKRTSVGGGWQVYDQLTAGSDLTGDGRPDLVATDRSGVLWLYKATGDTAKPFAPRVRIGGGWQIYNRIIATGNIGGSLAGDLLARDRAGVLWLYLGKGDGTFAPRTRIGAGWQRYSDIVAVGDGNKDGRPDLLVNDALSIGPDSLGFYTGTGDWKAPFLSRTQLYTQGPLGELNPTLF